MEFAFYNVNSIHGLTYMLNILCAKTRMLWLFPTSYKLSLVRITQFILTTSNNEQHQCKSVRVYEDGALEKSTDVTNLLVDEFKTSMENTGGDASLPNIKNEKHNKIIHNMVREGLIECNQHEKNWCCAAETSE